LDLWNPWRFLPDIFKNLLDTLYLLAVMKIQGFRSACLRVRKRYPIKVGGTVQEAKLIHKVEPVYPEQAKSSQLSGTEP
jgi:hypothetical protein